MKANKAVVAVVAVVLAGWMAGTARADLINVALNKPAWADSAYFPASWAVDDALSSWTAYGVGTQANPHWLVVDLEQAYSIDRIELTGASVPGYPGYTNVYNLYRSLNQIDWTLIGNGTLIDTTDPQDQWLTNGDSMRYLKYEVVGGTHWANLVELEAYAVPEPATLSLLALGGLAMIRRRRAR